MSGIMDFQIPCFPVPWKTRLNSEYLVHFSQAHPWKCHSGQFIALQPKHDETSCSLRLHQVVGYGIRGRALRGCTVKNYDYSGSWSFTFWFHNPMYRTLLTCSKPALTARNIWLELVYVNVPVLTKQGLGQKSLVLFRIKITSVYLQRKVLSNLQASLGKIMRHICDLQLEPAEVSQHTKQGWLATTLGISSNSKNTLPLIIPF